MVLVSLSFSSLTAVVSFGTKSKCAFDRSVDFGRAICCRFRLFPVVPVNRLCLLSWFVPLSVCSLTTGRRALQAYLKVQGNIENRLASKPLQLRDVVRLLLARFQESQDPQLSQSSVEQHKRLPLVVLLTADSGLKRGPQVSHIDQITCF